MANAKNQEDSGLVGYRDSGLPRVISRPKGRSKGKGLKQFRGKGSERLSNAPRLLLGVNSVLTL